MDGRALDPSDNDLHIDDWWEHHHQGDGNYKLWLTGSRPERVWYPLAIESRLRRGTVVLNIGVGLGHCTRALVQRGCTVHALDIAPAALAKIENVVTKTWLADNVSALPANTFDVAISHLVAQHMSDEQLTSQIGAVIPALKPDGVFALQFGTALDVRQNDLPTTALEALKMGSVVRSLGHVARLVDASGGQIVWADRIGMFPEYGSAWYAVHITRPDFPRPTTKRSGSVAGALRFAMLRALSAGNRLASVLGSRR